MSWNRSAERTGLEAEDRNGPAPSGRVDFEAALLYSDVAGFTALTEQLQRTGRQGAEQIAEWILAAFEPAIEAVERLGGTVASFGGDALFSVFLGRSATEQAQAAARELHQIFEMGSSKGAHLLQLTQALHWGRVQWLRLGTGARCHDLLVGPSVTALARLQSRTLPGGLRLSRAVQARLAMERAGTAVERFDAPTLPKNLSRGGGRWLGLASEYRNTSVLFLETRGWSWASLGRFYDELETILESYDGLLLKSDLSAWGSKWLCLFGFPVAHEDHVERAVQGVSALRSRLSGRLRWRAGLHSGTLVNFELGSAAQRRLDVMGDAVNTAARILGLASWGEVLLSEAVRRGLRRAACQSRGFPRLKGKADPLEVHALARQQGTGARSVQELAPLVGRETESERLAQALKEAAAGLGSALVLVGQPGMGKSRLAAEAMRMAKDLGFEVHRGQSISFGGVAYASLAQVLRSRLSLRENASQAELLRAVQDACRELGLSETDRHHLAEVLGARYEPSPLVHLEAKAIRLNNRLALRAFLAACHASAATKRGYLLWILEDLHWADELTLEAIGDLVQAPLSAPAVFLLTSRPEGELPTGLEQVVLQELTEPDLVDLLQALLRDKPPAVLLHAVLERVGGNPFFVEELFRHLVESGVIQCRNEGFQLLRNPEATDLPGTLVDVIASRLDRLGPLARQAIQLSAVLGRRFPRRLLEGFLELRLHLEAALAELSARDLVYQEGDDAEPLCVFYHALTREVAYNTILVRRRRELHRKVAEALEAEPSERREQNLSVLAHHWEYADRPDRARPLYLAAARQAGTRYALDAAERLYRGCLRLTQAPDAISIEARTELAANVYRFRGRFADALHEQGIAVAEARRCGERSLESRALNSLGLVHRSSGQSEEASRSHEAALALARESGDRWAEADAIHGIGAAYFDQGLTQEARPYMERSMDLMRQFENDRAQRVAMANLAQMWDRLGQFEKRDAMNSEALALARQSGDRRIEAYVLHNCGIHALDQGRTEEAAELHRQALVITREIGQRYLEAFALGNLGEVAAQQGRWAEALALLTEAAALHHRFGNRLYEAQTRRQIAFVHQHQGLVEEAEGSYQQLLVLHSQMADHKGLALAQLDLALLRRRCWGDLAGAERLLDQAEPILHEPPASLCICERGHLALARGRSVHALLDELRSRAARLRLMPEAELARAIARLQRAQDALDSGTALFHGELMEELPAGVRQWWESSR